MEIESYNADFKCDYCNLLAFMLKEVTFRSKFLANKGFLKIIGNIFYEKEESIIIKVAMQNNFSMYFGKGIQSAMEMAELYKMRGNTRVDLKRFEEAKIDYDKVLTKTLSPKP